MYTLFDFQVCEVDECKPKRLAKLVYKLLPLHQKLDNLFHLQCEGYQAHLNPCDKTHNLMCQKKEKGKRMHTRDSKFCEVHKFYMFKKHVVNNHVRNSIVAETVWSRRANASLKLEKMRRIIGYL